MTKFRRKSLTVFDRLYDFVGGERSVDQMDLAGSIQPVHDLSREAELGSRDLFIQDGGGFLSLGLTNTHVGASTEFESSSVYTAFQGISDLAGFNFGGNDQHRLWYLYSFATVGTGETAALNNAVCGFTYTLPATRVQGLWRATSALNALTAGGQQPLEMNDNMTHPPSYRPMYLPVGTNWNVSSSSSADMTCRFHMFFWAGPLGAPPPGMA